eukprot:s936_g13.t1
MCLQTSPWTAAQEAQAPRKTTVSSALVEEILANAAQASLEAPNRALKRREFGNAMERFKVMEANNEASGTTTVTAAPCSLAAAPSAAVQQAFIVQMPILMPMMQMVPNVSILSQPIMSAPVEPKSELVDVPDVASQSTMDDSCRERLNHLKSPSVVEDEDTISELSIEWQRANTLGSAHLPVERTFIQFDTRMHERDEFCSLSALLSQRNMNISATNVADNVCATSSLSHTKCSDILVELQRFCPMYDQRSLKRPMFVSAS